MRSELQRLILEQELDALNLTPLPEDEDVELISIEDAGLEELDQHTQPMFGFGQRSTEKREWRVDGGITDLIDWFSDGEDSRFEVN